MTIEELEAIFEEENTAEYKDAQYLKFENIKNKLSNRPDLHAFLLIDKLVPSDSDIIGAAEHDEFFINVDLEDLAKALTKEDVLDLIRCGARIEYGSICFFA